MRSDLLARVRAKGWLAGVGLAAALLASADPARAQDLDAGDEDVPVEIHAFVSQGAIKSTANNYLAQSDRGSLELAEVGINFTKSLVDRLRLGMQLFTRDLGPLGDYNAKLDWFYLDYRFTNWLGLRAGRNKLPFGLYNDISDVDAARVPILLPQAFYAARSRDFLLAQTGIEIYGYVPLGLTGGIDYRLYGGTIYVEIPKNNPSGISEFTVPYVAGGRVLWETPKEGLRVGGSVQALRFDLGLAIPPAMPGAPPAVDQAKLYALLWIGSVEYVAKDLLVAAEYGRWRIKIDSAIPRFARDWYSSERMYVMSSYRVRPWLTPGLYYSLFFPDTDKYSLFYRGGDAHKGHREDYQHDVAATLRFDINAHWLFKLEGHFMRGTADLQSALNDNQPLSRLTRDWGVFIAKTTAYF